MEHSRVLFSLSLFSNRFLPDGIYYNMCCNRLLYWEEDFPGQGLFEKFAGQDFTAGYIQMIMKYISRKL